MHAEVSIWTVLLLISAISSFVIASSAESRGFGIKYILPPLLILFGYRCLQDKEVMTRVAQVLLLAGIVPLLFLLYELVFGPISTSLRSGVLRIHGPYAQVAGYGIHLSMMLMAAGYLALKNKERSYFVILALLVAILSFSTAWLVHVSTWAVFLALLGLILLYLLRQRAWMKSLMILSIAVVSILCSFHLRSDQNYEWVLMPDVHVMTQDAPPEIFANSRGFIWENHLRDFHALPIYAQLFGSSLSGKNYFGGTGFGAHNDFLRILMATGIIGLLLYLVWLGRVIWSVFQSKGVVRFMGLAALIILLGYSVALTPTFIVPLAMVLLPVLAGVGGQGVKESRSQRVKESKG
jgi:O-antigen ligase